MKIQALSFREIRHKAEKISLDSQERNKLWWDALPMTYSDWDSKDRVPQSEADFIRIEKDFLSNNPWLEECFDFSQFKKSKVLEVGCGSGVASCIFAKQGAIVTSVDLSEKAIEISKLNAKAQVLNVEFLCMDAEKMAFDDDSYDFVFSWGVLHHSRDTFAGLKEIGRILKRGGRGMVMVYNKNSLRYYVLGLYYLIFKGMLFHGYNLQTVQRLFTDGYYHRHFTSRELVKCLYDAKLIVVDMAVSDLNAHVIPFLPNRINRWIRKHMGWFLIAEFVKN